MIRNLKFLGLALVAALAMSSVVAGMASADVFTLEATPTTITGAQEGTSVLVVHSGEAKCTTVKETGSFTVSPSSELSVSPTYSGCTFAGLAATTNMNGCTYRYTINSAAGNTTGTTDIICPAGKEITITAPSVGTPKCIIHIPAQNGLSSISFVNLGSTTTREITVNINITNMKYSQTAGTSETGNCATADNTTDGIYVGKRLLTGENAAGTAHIGIFVS